MTGPFKISALHVFIAEEDDGTEGVVAYHDPQQGWIPMVAADEARLQILRPAAQAMATSLNRNLRLIRVTEREEVEIIEPEKSDGE